MLKLQAIPLAMSETEEELHKLERVHLEVIKAFRDSVQAQSVKKKHDEADRCASRVLEQLEDEILKGMAPRKCKYCPI